MAPVSTKGKIGGNQAGLEAVVLGGGRKRHETHAKYRREKGGFPPYAKRIGICSAKEIGDSSSRLRRGKKGIKGGKARLEPVISTERE